MKWLLIFLLFYSCQPEQKVLLQTAAIDSVIQSRNELHLNSHTDTNGIIGIETNLIGASYQTVYYDSNFQLYSIKEKNFYDYKDERVLRDDKDAYHLISSYFDNDRKLIKVLSEHFAENQLVHTASYYIKNNSIFEQIGSDSTIGIYKIRSTSSEAKRFVNNHLSCFYGLGHMDNERDSLLITKHLIANNRKGYY